MLKTVTELLANQFEAVLCTLNTCVVCCPDSAWHAPVANHLFCQTVFHTLFYTDYYLGENADAFRRQPFHREYESFFGDYEELEDRAPRARYDKPEIRNYLQYCREKASRVLAAETSESLGARSGFERLAFTRAELHVHNIRHIQHHSGQLILRLRLDGGSDFPWFKTGWTG